MKMTPKLRWTFPASVDRIWPGPVRDGINTVGILSLSSIVFRQHKNKEEILTMDVWWLRLAQTVRAQTLILKHLNTIWSGMKYGAHILLWILMILLTHKISFYLLATFVRNIRALFPGLNGFLMMVRFLVDKIPDPIAHISQHFPLALLSGNWVTMPGHRIQVMILTQILNLYQTQIVRNVSKHLSRVSGMKSRAYKGNRLSQSEASIGQFNQSEGGGQDMSHVGLMNTEETNLVTSNLQVSTQLSEWVYP